MKANIEENKDVISFCEEHGLTINQFLGIDKIKGSLYLRSVTTLPDSFNPTVGGWLDLSSVTTLPDSFNPTVGGSLDLSSVTELPDSFSPTVGGWLDLRSVSTLPDSFNPTVGGWLDLSSVTELPDSFSPTVGGRLDLRSVSTLPDSFSPTVGDWLDLSSVTELPDSFSPTVGGRLDLRIGLNCNYNKLPKDSPIVWENGYIKVDGIFQKLVSKRGNIFRVQSIGSNKITYLVTDGTKYSHGETLKEAKEDLIYKISNVDKSEFSNLTLESELSFEKSIECYRVITGACSFGTKDFVLNRLKTKKDKFIIKEIIDLTTNEYGGSTFKQFFTK